VSVASPQIHGPASRCPFLVALFRAVRFKYCNRSHVRIARSLTCMYRGRRCRTESNSRAVISNSVNSRGGAKRQWNHMSPSRIVMLANLTLSSAPAALEIAQTHRAQSVARHKHRARFRKKASTPIGLTGRRGVLLVIGIARDSVNAQLKKTRSGGYRCPIAVRRGGPGIPEIAAMSLFNSSKASS